MKQTFASIAALTLSLIALRAAADIPLFSWDHVSVDAHVGKTSDDFTPEQQEFLAKHFNFITIGKDQASGCPCWRKRGAKSGPTSS